MPPQHATVAALHLRCTFRARSWSAAQVWASVRLLRRFTGMEKAAGDRVAHWMGRYNALVFGSVHVLHEALRPLLGCGVSNAAPRRE